MSDPKIQTDTAQALLKAGADAHDASQFTMVGGATISGIGSKTVNPSFLSAYVNHYANEVHVSENVKSIGKTFSKALAAGGLAAAVHPVAGLAIAGGIVLNDIFSGSAPNVGAKQKSDKYLG